LRLAFLDLLAHGLDDLLAGLSSLSKIKFKFRMLAQQTLQQLRGSRVGSIGLSGGDLGLCSALVIALIGQGDSQGLISVGPVWAISTALRQYFSVRLRCWSQRESPTRGPHSMSTIDFIDLERLTIEITLEKSWKL